MLVEKETKLDCALHCFGSLCSRKGRNEEKEGYLKCSRNQGMKLFHLLVRKFSNLLLWLCVS